MRSGLGSRYHYIRLRREFVYLAVIMDVFTRCLRGCTWAAVSNKASRSRRSNAPCWWHSANPSFRQGCSTLLQLTSNAYRNSMSNQHGGDR